MHIVVQSDSGPHRIDVENASAQMVNMFGGERMLVCVPHTGHSS